ncbi:MAG: hypothetical protein IJ737_03895 [Ruminococcus sp.]|nr:hypothetical protein [Ruminococcus sp.]
MQTQVAVVAIIVEKGASVDEVNAVLHKYSEDIIGRMGVPYRKKGVNIISIAVDAEKAVIEALEKEIGALDGVSAKTVYSADQ